MDQDQLQPETCEAIVAETARAIDAEPPSQTSDVRMPGGPVVGRQIMIDATEKGGLLNRCRLTVLNADLAPDGEAARLEYEHDKQGKFGIQRVYSIQSVRKRGTKLVLMENFLAPSADAVREEDFRPIGSEAYAQAALKTLQDWVRYRAWQLQEGKHV
jgi:hypothetical protein